MLIKPNLKRDLILRSKIRSLNLKIAKFTPSLFEVWFLVVFHCFRSRRLIMSYAPFLPLPDSYRTTTGHGPDKKPCRLLFFMNNYRTTTGQGPDNDRTKDKKTCCSNTYTHQTLKSKKQSSKFTILQADH